MNGPTAILVAGELNTDADAAQFKGEQTIPILIEGGLRWLFEGVGRPDRITWPADKGFPDAHFDHAFADGLEVGAVAVPVGFGECSDHRPVVIDVKPDPAE